jgi:hypothetical protein
MNRRDLLRHAGALTVGLPALRASGAASSIAQAGGKDLIVTFAGPFCYWSLPDGFKVMAPPIGKDFKYPHQAWTATSTNETMLDSPQLSPAPEYQLSIPGPARSPQTSGTETFSYAQEKAQGKAPLFTLIAPNPDVIIGVRPTKVDLSSSAGARQSDTRLLAAGLTFLYKNVDLTQVRLVAMPRASKPGQSSFQPCFINDEALCVAILSIHLSQVDQRPDPGHGQAHAVWAQMKAMYPWVDTEISFPGFDTAACPPDMSAKPQQGPAAGKKRAGAPEVGPGNDCEVPIMILGGQGSLRQRKP